VKSKHSYPFKCHPGEKPGPIDQPAQESNPLKHLLSNSAFDLTVLWIPALAGMTKKGCYFPQHGHSREHRKLEFLAGKESGSWSG
jgi:hypothetical protein